MASADPRARDMAFAAIGRVVSRNDTQMAFHPIRICKIAQEHIYVRDGQVRMHHHAKFCDIVDGLRKQSLEKQAEDVHDENVARRGNGDGAGLSGRQRS
eukprot:12427024-Karenia_brevis.AAC.1